MKKLLSILLISCLCLPLASCGAATLEGDPAVYQNANKSFSVELPAKNEDSWIINEESDKDILDMVDSKETVNVVVQCLSKSKAKPIASDLETYKSYVTETLFTEYLAGSELKDTDIEVPEFITTSNAYTYKTDKTEGIVVCMESEKCYYTYLVRAVEEGYDVNKKAIGESILSLEELTKIAE